RQPEQRESDDQQCATGRQPSAFSEHPRHSGFKGVVERMFEGLVADVAPEPDPLLMHSCAPCLALRPGHGEALDNTLQKQLYAVRQTCTVACEANERILNTFAIGPGGTFSFEEENRATFLPQRRGASAKVVLTCSQK